MPDATHTLTIAELSSPADAEAFRTLNEAWIERYFTLEDEDRAILGDPVGRIVEPAGRCSSHASTPRSSAASGSCPSATAWSNS